MITLYLYTVYGIFIWDQYPTLHECSEVRTQLTQWFDKKSIAQLYSIECIKVGDIK